MQGRQYTVGALAKMADISADTLRYYDDIGLLKPHYTSRETKYRYYTEAQAAVLSRILELKLYGFTLAEIKEILEKGDEALTDAYLKRYWALEGEKKKIQQAIDDLSEKIKQKMEGFGMNKKILLADDSAFMRLMLADMLSKNGYDVAGEAQDGQEAVEMYKKLKPDIALLNIEMPMQNGIMALRSIREFDENANAVMLSALCNVRSVASALMAGARSFVAKPFQPDMLLARLKDAFSQAGRTNKEIVEKLLESGDSKELTQQEIDYITNLAFSGGTAAEAAPAIEALNIANPAGIGDALRYMEKFGKVDARLDKLEKGQEEMLEILRSLNGASSKPQTERGAAC